MNARLATALTLTALLSGPSLHAQPARPRTPPHTTPRPQPQAAPSPPPVPLSPAEAAVAQCRALLEFGVVTAGPVTTEALDDGGCRYTGVRFGFTSRAGYEVETLIEHGMPTEAPKTPVTVQVEAHGIVLAIESMDRKANWLSRQQQIPFDVTLDTTYDPAAHRVTTRSLTLDSPTLGHTTLAFELTGIDEGTFPDDAALRTLRLHMDSQRLLVQFALPAAVAALPGGDLSAEMAQAKTRLAVLARAYLPRAGATPETVDALATLVADFPRAQHVLDLTVSANPPFPFRAVGDSEGKPAAIDALLRTLSVAATYTGAPH